MLLNIALLILTMIIIYFGYTYKAIIFFFVSMLIDDFYTFFYILKSYKMSYSPEKQIYTMKFFINKKEYMMIIPEEDLHYTEKSKILAMCNTSNETKFILKVLGPCKNFFGSNLKIKHLGFDNLTIWKDKKRYKFKEEDYLNFDQENKYETSDDDSSFSS